MATRTARDTPALDTGVEGFEADGGAAIAQAYRDATNQLIAQRVPLGVALFFVTVAIASFLEWQYYPDRHRALITAGSVDVIVLLLQFAVLRAPAPFLLPMTVGVCCALTSCLAWYFAWVGGD